MAHRRTARPLDPSPALARSAPSAGLAVVGREQAAAALLDPIRRRILAELQTPGSASSVAAALDLPRQRVNYHVRALQQAGLVEEVGRRQRRGLAERLVRATAAHYLISPAVGALGQTPTAAADRFSASYQVAVAARTIREVAELSTLANDAGKRLTTLTLDTEIRLATPAAREAFANELFETMTALVAKYHDAGARDGRDYRVFAGAHPTYRAPEIEERHSNTNRSRR